MLGVSDDLSANRTTIGGAALHVPGLGAVMKEAVTSIVRERLITQKNLPKIISSSVVDIVVQEVS